MSGYYGESAGYYLPRDEYADYYIYPPVNESAGNYYPPRNEPVVYHYRPRANEIALPVVSRLSQQREVLPEPNYRPFRSCPVPGVSPAEPRVSTSGDGIHLPRLDDTPPPQLARAGAFLLRPVQELIRDVDDHFGPPWNQRSRSGVVNFQGPGSRAPTGGDDVDCFGRLEGATSFIHRVFLHRNEDPGTFYGMGDGSMVYESETINGRVVNYRDAGPPTFQWDEVRPEAGHGWAGHAIYAAYNDEIKEQEEVPDDNEWSRSLREVESHYVLYEQWHNQNPPPESHDENRQDLRAAAGGEATR